MAAATLAANVVRQPEGAHARNDLSAVSEVLKLIAALDEESPTTTLRHARVVYEELYQKARASQALEQDQPPALPQQSREGGAYTEQYDREERPLPPHSNTGLAMPASYCAPSTAPQSGEGSAELGVDNLDPTSFGDLFNPSSTEYSLDILLGGTYMHPF